MRRRIASLLRRTADRLSPPEPVPRIEFHGDAVAVRDALLRLKRRNGDLGLS